MYLRARGINSMAGFYMAPQGGAVYLSIRQMDVQGLAAIEGGLILVEQSFKHRPRALSSLQWMQADSNGDLLVSVRVRVR